MSKFYLKKTWHPKNVVPFILKKKESERKSYNKYVALCFSIFQISLLAIRMIFKHKQKNLSQNLQILMLFFFQAPF